MRRILLGAGLWTLGSNVGRTLTRIFSVAVLARLLTPEDYGVYAAAFVVLGLAHVLSDIGIGQAIIQRPELSERHVAAGVFIGLLVGVSLGAVLFMASGAIAAAVRVPEAAVIIQVFALIVPLRSYAAVAEAMARRDLRLERLAMIDYGTFLFGTVAVTITLAALGWGYWALVVGFLATQISRSFAVVAVAGQWVAPRLDGAAAGELMEKGVGFSAARLLQYVAAKGDYFVVSRYLGAAPLGIYNRAYRIMDMANVVVGRTADSVLFPVFSKFSHDVQRLRRAFVAATQAGAVLLLPASASLIMAAPEVVLALLGPRWVSVTPVLQVLGVGMWLRLGYKLSTAMTHALGRVYTVVLHKAVYAVLVVGGGYLAANFIGLAGVAWAVLAAMSAQYVQQSVSAAKALRISVGEWVTLHLPGVALTAGHVLASALVLSAARSRLDWPFVLAAYGVYVAAFYLLTILFLPERFVGEEVKRLGGALRHQARRLAPNGPRDEEG